MDRRYCLHGLLAIDAMLDAYERESGLPVNRRAVEYYRVFFCYRAAVIILGTCVRAPRAGKTHRDLTVQGFPGLRSATWKKPAGLSRGSVEIELRPEYLLPVIAKTLQDVVLPVLDNHQQVAQEQLKLAIGFLTIMAQRCRHRPG